MISSVKIWFQDIIEYFRFVHLRRADQRFGILPKLSNSLIFLTLSAAMIVALFLFADQIVLEWIRQPDRQYPKIFRTITLLGSVNWILFITGAILILLSLRNARRFKGQKYLIWHRLFLNAYFAFTGIVFSGLLGNLFKNLIGRARPQFTPEPDIWVSIPFEHHYQFASFPSGHATTGGAIAVTLALLFPRWWLFFIIGGILVAVSRPVLGVHFPSDVLAGFLFGGSFIWIYARIFARKRLLFVFDDQGKLVLRGERKSRALSGNVGGAEMNR
jgi:membrane-associated phospholipid phosphatase